MTSDERETRKRKAQALRDRITRESALSRSARKAVGDKVLKVRPIGADHKRDSNPKKGQNHGTD